MYIAVVKILPATNFLGQRVRARKIGSNDWGKQMGWNCGMSPSENAVAAAKTVYPDCKKYTPFCDSDGNYVVVCE